MNKKSILICVIAGALCAACFYVSQAAFLMWFLPVPALFFIFSEGENSGRKSVRRSIKLAACFALTFLFCSYLVGFTIDVYFSPPVMLLIDFALILVASIIQSIPLIIALCIGSRLRIPLAIRAAVVAVLWTAAEWLTTVGAFAFPVRLFAVSQWSMPAIIKSSAVFGELFISFTMILFASLLAFSAKAHLRSKKTGGSGYGRSAMILLFVSFIVFAGNLAIGSFYTKSISGTSKPGSVRVAAIQHNQPITDADYTRFEKAYAQAISVLKKNNDIELLLLPESTAQFVREDEEMQTVLASAARQYNVDIMVGGANSPGDTMTFEQRKGEGAGGEGSGIVNLSKDMKKGIILENAVHMFTRDGVMSNYYYAKQQLVPFFENGSIQKFSFFSGNERGIFKTSKGRVGAVICFESVMPQTVRDTVRKGAELIIVPSNDAYLGKEIRRMHISQSVLRAIETDRAVIQVATNGVTAVAYPDGTLKSIPMNKEDVLIADIPIIDTKTLYVRYGNLWLIIACAALSLYIIFRVIRRRTVS